MAVSAVEQLQVMASKRQYKEAAAQLEVLSFEFTIHICATMGWWFCNYVISSPFSFYCQRALNFALLLYGTFLGPFYFEFFVDESSMPLVLRT